MVSSIDSRPCRCPAVLLLCLALAACGSDGGGNGGITLGSGGGSVSDVTTPDNPTPGNPTRGKTIDPSATGSVSGVVSFTGTLGELRFQRMVGEAWCMEQHPPKGGYLDDRIHVEDGKLANCFVWVKVGLESYEFDTPSEVAVVNQSQCLFEPRVQGIMAGQGLEAHQNDAVMHNIHTKPKRSSEQNFGMPVGSSPRRLKLKRPEIMVEIVCDVHAWMRGWIGVVDHPFFATTGTDGAWEFDGLPAGDYTIGLWHEKLGEQELSITIEVGGSAEADASYS